MNMLFIINDPPYGTERAYNALRLAYSLVQRDGTGVRVFLIGDAVSCARSGQQTPNGYYNLEPCSARSPAAAVRLVCAPAAWTREASLTRNSSKARVAAAWTS